MTEVKPTALLILDGYGLGENTASNAIFSAKTPVMDSLMKKYPMAKLEASGLAVGLPEGQMGNSEVGHTNIGAGRIVYQDLPKITKEIEEGDFYGNAAYCEALEKARDNNKAVHILGLLSDGGVHSHIGHIFAIIDLANRVGVEEIYIHCFLDGRDVAPKSAHTYLKSLVDYCEEIENAKIASIQGRFWGMDRDKRWDRVQKGYDAIVKAQAKFSEDVLKAINESYDMGITDEFVEPVIFCDRGIIDGDSVIFMNFRPDRAREMTWAITGNLPENSGMDILSLDINFVCTTSYDASLDLAVAYPARKIKNTIGEYLSNRGISQFRVAETEKYAHVTFFLNGGVEKQFEGETRILIPSPQEVKTYDEKPEMSAKAVSQALISAMHSGNYDFFVCNLANCDMVGHTGNMEAAVKAVEFVDECLGEIQKAAVEKGIILAVTADHGNADRMIEIDGRVNTAHTTNLVPFIVCDEDVVLASEGSLCDIAASLLKLMDIEAPIEMTGRSLV